MAFMPEVRCASKTTAIPITIEFSRDHLRLALKNKAFRFRYTGNYNNFQYKGGLSFFPYHYGNYEMRPRYIKFSTASGNHYVYAPDSNEILKVSKAVFSIIDGFRVLDDKALLKRYNNEFCEEELREAIGALSLATKDGLSNLCLLKKLPML